MSNAPGVATSLLSGRAGAHQPASPVWGAMSALGGNVHLMKTKTASDAGVGAGFVLSLLHKAQQNGFVVWVTQSISSLDGGVLYGPGLYDYGLDPNKIVYVEANSLKNVFWCLEEALKTSSVSAVVGEFHTAKPLDLTFTRRLALRAERTGVPVYLLAANSVPFASAAQTHWCVSGRAQDRTSHPHPYVGPPIWSLSLDKNKKGPCGGGIVGYDAREGAHFTPSAKRLTRTRDTAGSPLAGAGASLEPVVVRLAAERRKAALHRRLRQ